MPSIHDLSWPLTTERLEIRPAVGPDVDAVWGFRRQAAVHEWLGGARTDRDSFEVAFHEPDRLAKTLVVVHEARIVGDLMVMVGDGWSQAEVRAAAVGSEAELGWTLDPAYGGRGLATEAVRAVIDLAFAAAPTGLGLRRVTAGCFAANEPSWRLMERLGMRREQHGVRDSLHRDHGWVDGYTYALLAEEWPTAGRAG